MGRLKRRVKSLLRRLANRVAARTGYIRSLPRDISTVPREPISALYFYNAYNMNPTALVSEFACGDLRPQPDVAINFIGLKTPIDVYPPILEGMLGTVEGPPEPGNWHADIAEWASAFHAVKEAGETFRIIELGCGWGCWLANTGIAARKLKKSVQLIGVEGEAGHLANARKTLELNGFSDREFALFHGVAGPSSGLAIFPNHEAGDAAWGGEAIFSPSPEQIEDAKADPGRQVLDVYTLDALTSGEIVDLLHIDIQGAEVDFVRGNFEEIEKLVRRVLIGTHSRVIEGQLMEFFLDAGWTIEMERTAIMPLDAGRPQIAIDGVHLWVNPRFT